MPRNPIFKRRKVDDIMPSLLLFCEFVHAFTIIFKMKFGKNEKIPKTKFKD